MSRLEACRNLLRALASLLRAVGSTEVFIAAEEQLRFASWKSQGEGTGEPTA